MSWSIIAAWALNSYCNHVVLCATSSNLSWCIAWMCCRMSNSIKLVWACPDLSLDRLGLYTFLHSLRSYFSPSRPLQHWFEAACETSLARDKFAMQSTQKAVEGATALFVCLYSSSWMISVRDKKLARANSEFFRYLFLDMRRTLFFKKPSTLTHRLDTCLHSLRLNSSSLYPMLL